MTNWMKDVLTQATFQQIKWTVAQCTSSCLCCHNEYYVFLFPLLTYFPPSIFQRQAKWAVACSQQNTSALINHEKVNYTSFCELLWPFIISLVSETLKSSDPKNSNSSPSLADKQFILSVLSALVPVNISNVCLKSNKCWLTVRFNPPIEIKKTLCVLLEICNSNSSAESYRLANATMKSYPWVTHFKDSVNPLIPFVLADETYAQVEVRWCCAGVIRCHQTNRTFNRCSKTNKSVREMSMKPNLYTTQSWEGV